MATRSGRQYGKYVARGPILSGSEAVSGGEVGGGSEAGQEQSLQQGSAGNGAPRLQVQNQERPSGAGDNEALGHQ